MKKYFRSKEALGLLLKVPEGLPTTPVYIWQGFDKNSSNIYFLDKLKDLIQFMYVLQNFSIKLVFPQ